VVFVLACNVVTQPVKDAQNLAATAQSIGSAIPIETLKALPSAVPIETLEALPSMAPTLEAFETAIPNMFNPEGNPVQEWKGIPVMPQATAGEEFTKESSYSFKATVTIKDVQDFYNEKLPALGWKQPFNLSPEGDAALMVFQKDSSTLTVTITSSKDTCVVVLTMP
jgi:hypothetical protein